MIYQCLDCGAVFDEPKEVYTGVESEGIKEKAMGCPSCGSCDIEEGYECLCGNFSEYPVCDDCVSKALKEVRAVLFDYWESDEQRDYLTTEIAEEL